MKLFYKMEGYVSYENPSNTVIDRAQQIWDMNIPVTVDTVNKNEIKMDVLNPLLDFRSTKERTKTLKTYFWIVCNLE